MSAHDPLTNERASLFPAVQSPPMPELVPPLYVGCWRRAGHGLFQPGMKSVPWRRMAPSLDGGYLPKSRKEGLAKLTHLRDRWTILDFNDYSVDSRGGSHSLFLLDGKLGFEEALVAAREAFPEVFERFSFEITEETL